MFTKIIIHLLSFFLFINAFSQNCDCNESTVKDINSLKKSSNEFCKAEYYFQNARNHILNHQPDSAEYFANNVIDILEKQHCTTDILLTSYKILANVFYYRNDYEKQVQISFKINKLLIERNDTLDIALGLMNLSILFFDINQGSKSMTYVYQALPYIDKVKEPVSKSELLIKLSKCYINAFQTYKNKAYLDTAQNYVLEAQKHISLKIDRRLQFLIWSRLSTINAANHNFDLQLRFIDSTLKYCDREQNIQEVVSNFCDKVDALIELKRYKDARKIGDSALYYAQKLNSPLQLAKVYGQHYKVDKALKKSEKALYFLELQKKIVDSLKIAESATKVTELERKYTQAQNEKTIQELSFTNQVFKLRQQLLISVLVVLALILVFIFIFFRQRQIRNKYSLLEANLRLEQTKLNPHFIFNTLASLQNLALQAEPHKTATFIAKYAKSIRQVLESSYHDMVSLEEEKEFIETYLDLQKLRYDGKFEYNIFIDSHIAQDELLIPPMLLQPFLENAIEHGFKNIGYKGILQISFFKKESLEIVIEDNGYASDNSAKNNYPSRSTQITNDRLLLLNQKYSIKGEFKTELSPENGVNYRVVISLNV